MIRIVIFFLGLLGFISRWGIIVTLICFSYELSVMTNQCIGTSFLSAASKSFILHLLQLDVCLPRILIPPSRTDMTELTAAGIRTKE